MVINDFHVVLQTVFPSENDSPLLVDPHTPKSLQITAQLLKSITRRDSEILDDSCLIDHPKFASRPRLDITRQLSNTQTSVNVLCIGIAEALDHKNTVAVYRITASVIFFAETLKLCRGDTRRRIHLDLVNVSGMGKRDAK